MPGTLQPRATHLSLAMAPELSVPLPAALRASIGRPSRQFHPALLSPKNCGAPRRDRHRRRRGRQGRLLLTRRPRPSSATAGQFALRDGRVASRPRARPGRAARTARGAGPAPGRMRSWHPRRLRTQSGFRIRPLWSGSRTRPASRRDPAKWRASPRSAGGTGLARVRRCQARPAHDSHHLPVPAVRSAANCTPPPADPYQSARSRSPGATPASAT